MHTYIHTHIHTYIQVEPKFLRNTLDWSDFPESRVKTSTGRKFYKDPLSVDDIAGAQVIIIILSMYVYVYI